MKYILYNDKKEIVTEVTDKKEVLERFTEELFNKYVLKSNNYKQVQYKYNYSDRQKITFIYKNNYRCVYDEIPTKCGFFDRYTIDE